MDASLAGLREASRRAIRARLENAVYVRAAIEALPPELEGVADRVTIVLPWGSLLTAVGLPSVPLLSGIRALCRPGATLTVLMGVDPVRDRSEVLRLGLPPLTGRELGDRVAKAYAEAELLVTAVRPIGRDELLRWPSTWAKRLGHGRPRPVFRIDACLV